MRKLDEGASRTLLAVARTLYPYDYLDDSYYAVVLASIEKEADADRVILLTEGARSLDRFADAPFHTLPEERRVEALKAVEGTAFFNDMRFTTVRELYNNPAIWPHFGYEGPSGHKGGYVKRGFDHGDWIPDA